MGAAGELSLDNCYELLFTEEERSEYGYEKEAFEEDLTAWNGGCLPTHLSVHQALAFLAESQ